MAMQQQIFQNVQWLLAGGHIDCNVLFVFDQFQCHRWSFVAGAFRRTEQDPNAVLLCLLPCGMLMDSRADTRTNITNINKPHKQRSQIQDYKNDLMQETTFSMLCVLL